MYNVAWLEPKKWYPKLGYENDQVNSKNIAKSLREAI